MQNLLAFDTSSSALSLALLTGGKVHETRLDGFFGHAENLIPMIQKLLKKNRLSPADLDAFLIGRGPGSFTGLRIGFSTLRGLLISAPVPCLGALSLDMAAENIDAEEGTRLAVCFDARRQKFYTRFYIRKRHGWKPEGPAEVLESPVLASRLTPGTWVTGDALERHTAFFTEEAGLNPADLQEKSRWYPRAAVLIEWHQKRDRRLKALKKSVDFLPLYFRRSEAEEKREAHGIRH